jgi:hypothetical protein
VIAIGFAFLAAAVAPAAPPVIGRVIIAAAGRADNGL